MTEYSSLIELAEKYFPDVTIEKAGIITEDGSDVAHLSLIIPSKFIREYQKSMGHGGAEPRDWNNFFNETQLFSLISDSDDEQVTDSLLEYLSNDVYIELINARKGYLRLEITEAPGQKEE